MIDPGQLVLLISHKGKRYLRKLEAGGEVHTHDGKLLMDDIAENGFGQYVNTHLGRPYLILKPTLHDLIKGVKRQTQIMYPKEIGYLMMKLGIGPGSTVIESGTGSGGLTTALAWFVGDTGKVITYERRADFFKLAGKNLERVGLSHRVEQVNQNIEDGFLHSGADACSSTYAPRGNTCIPSRTQSPPAPCAASCCPPPIRYPTCCAALKTVRSRIWKCSKSSCATGNPFPTGSVRTTAWWPTPVSSCSPATWSRPGRSQAGTGGRKSPCTGRNPGDRRNS